MNAATMQVACWSRDARARSNLIVVRGSACEAASWTSRSGTPASKPVESSVPAELNAVPFRLAGLVIGQGW
jgi:hypothetical protein